MSARTPNSSSQSLGTLEKYKLVFLGDQNVGKTSIITRFMYDSFDTSYQATIGIDFLCKTMYLDNRTVRLQLWDTAGHDRFRSINRIYYRDAAAALIVYDVTRRDSLYQDADHWLKDVKENAPGHVIIGIVGNKCDMVSKRKVSPE